MSSPTFSLVSTTFAASLNGSVNETFNGQVYNFPFSYSFSASFTNGTGAGKALNGVLGQLQLTGLANPTVAPTLVGSVSGGSIAAGTYTFEYSYYNASGETVASPASLSVTTTGSASSVTVTAPALPSGATGVNIYLASGGSGTGKVGTAASNVCVVTSLATGTAIPSVNSATIASTIDLTSLATPSKTLDMSGLDHGNGAGGTNGVKVFGVENTDATTGQVITFNPTVSNGWTNGMGGQVTMGPAPSGRYLCDALGFAVASNNRLISVQAKYGTPLINFLALGEPSWF